MNNRVLLTGANGLVGKTFLAHQRDFLHYLLEIRDHHYVLNTVHTPTAEKVFTFSELANAIPPDVTHILHFGANTSTLESNQQSFNTLNVESTKNLVALSCERGANLIFASSAAVYGNLELMSEDIEIPRPANLYAASKWESENFIKEFCHCVTPHITTLRLFNLYGLEENHKGPMKSIVSRFLDNVQAKEKNSIFTLSNQEPGSQSRDFVFVEDLCDFTCEYLLEDQCYGLINFGSGVSTTFLQISKHLRKRFGYNQVVFTPMPSEFKTHYQWKTQSDNSRFKSFFPDFVFTELEQGIEKLLQSNDK